MCYMIAVGKNASVDGSVLVGRNCDSLPTNAGRIVSVPRKKHAPGTMVEIPISNDLPGGQALSYDWTNRPAAIPQVPETYAYTASLRIVPGESMAKVMGGINEYQVTSGASTGGWVKKEVEELTPWLETVQGDFLMTLALERSKTAREAVLFLGEMTEAYGGRLDNYIFSDPQEAWLFEQYQGTHWAAVRVPDDCYMVQGNSFRIAEVHPEDPENYLCDPDLIPFAIKHDLWDPDSGEPFHASKAYGTTDRNRPRGDLEQPYYSLHRVWRGISLLSPSLDLDPYEPSKEYPLFVKPDKKISVKDVLTVLKDHYEGTPLDEYGAQDEAYPTVVDAPTGHYRRAPAWSASRIIGCPQTVSSWVTQSREGLPNEVGGVLWGGFAAAASGPHMPWYSCNRRVPRAFEIGDAGEAGRYQPESAYWLFENIGNLMNLMYQGTVGLVRPRWDAFEDELFSRQEALEAYAVELIRQGKTDEAVEFLTEYSCGVGYRALDVGQEMLGNLFTRIALLNNPQTARGYQDPTTWEDSAAAVY